MVAARKKIIQSRDVDCVELARFDSLRLLGMFRPRRHPSPRLTVELITSLDNNCVKVSLSRADMRCARPHVPDNRLLCKQALYHRKGRF